ncbi:MAG: hypothetical protein WC147_12610, partial [Syntrophomonas sp.]
GEKWHTSENLLEDMHRQAILERLGWTFVRIRGSEYYLDPDNSMKIVFDRLKNLGISPELNNSNKSNKNSDHEMLSDEVIRVAHDILRSWDKDNRDNETLESIKDVV